MQAALEHAGIVDSYGNSILRNESDDAGNSSDEVHSYSDDSVLSLDPAEILREIFSKNPQFEGYGEYTRQLQTYRDLQRTADRNQAKIENYDSEVVKLLRSNDYVRTINQKRRRLAEIDADLAGNRIGLIF